MILIQQTWFKLIYKLHETILNLMIMFLTMTHSLMMMMINQLKLIMSSIKLQTYMKINTISHNQSVILKTFIINQDLQNFNQWTNFPNPLNFPTMMLCMTLLHRSITNQIAFQQIKILQHKYSNQIWTTTTNEKKIVFSFHHFPLRINNLFHEGWIE